MSKEEIKNLIDTAAEVTFPEPEPLIQQSENNLPYPIDAFPPLMADVIKKYQQYGQQPISLVASSALASASLATQGLVNVGRDNNLIGPTSLSILIIAQSGERKSSADKFMTKPIRDWQAKYIEENKELVIAGKVLLEAHEAEKANILSSLKSNKNLKDLDREMLKKKLIELESKIPVVPIMPDNIFLEDCTPEAFAQKIAEGWPSVSLASDEAGIIIGGQGMREDSAIGYFGLINRLWDGQRFERSRMTAKSFVIEGRRLTCSLMMQEAVLTELLRIKKGISRGIGFLARFLIVQPSSTMGLRLYKDIDLKNSIEVMRWNNRICELLSVPLPIVGDKMTLNPPTLFLSEEAKSEWIRYNNDIERSLAKFEEFGGISDFAAKAAENAARIAAIFHIVEKGPIGEIDIHTIQAAASVTSWYLNEAKKLFTAIKTPEHISDALLLIEWMQRKSIYEISARDILNRGPNILREKDRRDRALSLLIDRYYLMECKTEKSTIYRLNPHLIQGKKCQF